MLKISNFMKNLFGIMVFCVTVPLYAPSISLSFGMEEQLVSEKQVKKVLSELAQKIEDQKIAQTILSSQPHHYVSFEKIITDIEWNELQLNRLVAVLSRTETSFGNTGLKWLLNPVKDLNEIRRRQTIIQSLTQDDSLFNQLQQALQKVKKGERALLNYWKDHYQLHQDVQMFDYTLPKFKKILNKNELALEGGAWFTLGKALWALAGQLCLTGLWHEFTNTKVGESFTLHRAYEGFKRGLRQPFNFLNPNHDILAKDLYADVLNPNKSKTIKDLSVGTWLGIIGSGSAGDRYKCTYDLYQSKIGHVGAQIAGGATVGAFALLYGAFYYMTFKQTWDWFKKSKNVSRDLHNSLVDIASLVRSVGEVEQVVDKSDVLRACNVKKYFQKITNKNKRSGNLKKLIDLLESSTFNKGSTLAHRRGRVLYVHKLLQHIKKELVPALQAIAEFDAYLSLAKLVKEKQATTYNFSFATFAIQQEPLINVHACWIDKGMIAADTVVTNDILFGDDHSKKVIITGPNGGGKSTYLKSLGQAICMAQGWGIVAAQNAHLALFTGVRTSLDPKEDMSRGISTFMAQKERIKSIEDFIDISKPEDKYLIMLDEPYRGTTDEESADRIWHFGQRVAHMPQCITLIATHVKKPIQLEKETNGLFTNLQVEIDELESGNFKRTFKIKPGAAMWWFNEAARRSRFVDWLDDEIKAQVQKNNKIVLSSLGNIYSK